jgi:hypothetical protein
MDLAPDWHWTLAWVVVPLILGAWLMLGWWHCFTSDWGTGGLLLLLVACAAWLTLFRLGYSLRLPDWSGHPLPQFWVLVFLGGWVVGFFWTALVAADRAYRGDKNWPQEYAKRERDQKRANRQQGIGALGALQLLVVLLLLFGYLAGNVLPSLIYSLALGTPVGVLLFLFVWRRLEP